MSAAPGDRRQAAAARYLARRMERALVLGDPRGGPDAVRPPSFWVLVGAALAALLTAGSMLLELLRPPATLGAEPIVMDRDSGALYARIDEVLHPALNLTSARLATGSAEQPRAVGHEAIDAAKRGAPIGIPGAPQRIGPALSEAESRWTVCDGGHTTIIAGATPEPARGGLAPLPATQPILARGPNGATQLLYDGRRAAVALDDPAARRALRLEGAIPVAVSAALLGLVPEAAPLVAPPIPGRGNPGPSGLPGTRIGDVVRVERADGAEHFVVLAGGVQPVGAVLAELLTFADAGREVPTLTAAVLTGVPTVGVLAVAGYPDHLDPLAPEPAVVCATWRPDGAVHLEVGDAAPVEAPIRLAQADGDGPAVDEVHLPPGRSLFVRPDRGPREATLVSENGVRFPLVDPDAPGLLGLPESAVPAPWSVVAALPAGPPLGRAQASVARDVVAPAAAGQRGRADQ
ncbi:type VII secretion protein EccB [[Mycobacterium] wendilense]|uniref:Type VII secretion protein EccB n=1 Tax=[Mycobacterium] wendilense TaxID=3064284 RepID=A0ABN9P656_9MYCO|nr:type VII secretion protein EccB [Mycolicibacterium sp. MU0050]CAJ1585166.1 type VII secretion protein EccB [Mycolicibacterium sp. MU0050]